MLFLVDWDIWNQSFEAIAARIVGGLRATAGSSATLIDAPAHVCNAAQLVDVQALLFTALAFGWDAYLVPDTGECLIEVSHDGWLRGWATSAATHQAVNVMLQPWKIPEK